MRLDAQREHKKTKRRGLTRRTIFAVIWLGFCTAVAYLLLTWLLDTERLRMSFFYFQLHIPQNVSQEIIIAVTVVVLVVIINFFLLIGYGLASPSGRRHPGTPSSYSPDPDPDDRKFDYR